MVAQPIRTIKIFYCYAQEDDTLREELARHLSPFRRLRYITGWYNRNIQAGTDWEKESRTHLDTANIILLLLSADFFASDYHYAVEMERAIRKHKAGTAHVIPILLRPVDWKETPIAELSALPVNEQPVTQWANRDEAWLNIVQGIREVIRDLLQKQPLSSEENDVLYPEQGPLSDQIVGDKYLLGELLGVGGFSQVYKAQHIEIQRQQAVKVLHEHHCRKLEFRNRFLREAQTVASLDHSNIIHLDDFWTTASQAYLVMPFISGGTLQGILDKQQGFLEQDQIIFYLECICAALDYAHEKGIAHLDLKPLNLLVHEDGRLLLSDFGLAHLIKQGRIVGGSSLRAGTPHYMAPEHIHGFPEKRSDLFSLGVILYQMVVGQLPFNGLPEDSILLKNVMEWPPAPRSLRPELSQSVEDMLGKAIAKQPEHRYQTANEFLIAFKNASMPALHVSHISHSMDSPEQSGGDQVDIEYLAEQERGQRSTEAKQVPLPESEEVSEVAKAEASRIPPRSTRALLQPHKGQLPKPKRVRKVAKAEASRIPPRATRTLLQPDEEQPFTALNERQLYTALSIGTAYAKAIIVEVRGDHAEVLGAGRYPQSYTHMADGIVTDIDGVIANCNEALLRAELAAGGVIAPFAVFDITGELVKASSITVSKQRQNPSKPISADELDQLISAALNKLLKNAKERIAAETGLQNIDVRLANAAIVSVRIDGQTVNNPIDSRGRQLALTLFSAFAPLTQLGALENVALGLDLTLGAIVAAPYALARCLSYKASADSGAIFIDIGGGTTDIALVRQGGIEEARMFALGGRSFTRRLANGRGTSMKEAERLKLSYSRGELKETLRDEVKAILAPECQTWMDSVELLIDDVAKREMLPPAIYIAGGGSGLPDLREKLENFPWTQRLPFSHQPIIRTVQPEMVGSILDQEGMLHDAQDITPMALAFQAIELQNENTVLERALDRAITHMYI